MKWSKENKAKLKIFYDPKLAIKNSDVIITDKVVSMNDRVNKKKKKVHFEKFKINKQLIKLAKNNAIFLHCLPRGDEVSEDVFLGKNSKVWTQASNRVHVQKSILLYCLEKLR